LLPRQQIPGPKHQTRRLLFALHRHEPHAGTLRRFADGLGIFDTDASLKWCSTFVLFAPERNRRLGLADLNHSSVRAILSGQGGMALL
jgi:hypothetical protein